MSGSYALTFGRGEHRYALEARAAAEGLAIVDQPNLLLVTTEGASIIHSEHGVLVGRGFGDSQMPLVEVPVIDAGPLDALRQRCTSLWGNIAWFEGDPDRCFAYRDPSGGVPVYRLDDGDRAIFVSDAGIALRLGLLEEASCDLSFAVHWLQYPYLRTARTGLGSVRELLPGVIGLKAGPERWSEVPGWSPAPFVRRKGAITDPAHAAARLRELLLAAVPAQLGAERLLLELSGGLDSSIIAACLGRAGMAPRCINFATRSADGDERSYARDVAATFDLAMVELTEAGPARLASDAIPSFHPSTNPLLEPFERAIACAAAELGASLLVDGGGGDNLFCSVSTASPVIDALRWSGPAAAGTAIADVAARAGCTWWAVAAAAARKAVRPAPGWKEDRRFLAREALIEREDAHPWLDGLGAVPPGKREHLMALVHIQHFLDRGGSGLPRLHPLMARPLIELCLRIPTWLWVRGGINRAIARDAFAGILPSSVLDRRTKGSLQGMFHRSFPALRGELLGLLLSGELAAARIIDCAAVEAVLAGDAPVADLDQLRLTEMAALELFLQSWRSRRLGGS